MNDFNGIWLAAPILELPDLNLTEKVILSQVIALSREGECNAQNDYIASRTRLTTTTTSTTLGRLEDKGYLEINAGKQQGNKRTLWPSLKSLHTLFKNLKEGDASSLKIFKTLYKNFKEVYTTPPKETERPYLKILHTLFQNFKELIYRIDNKTDNKEDNKPSKEYKAVPARADAPFWSILIKLIPFYSDRKAYKAFVKAELKKNSPPCDAPPLSENQFAYEHAAGKTEILQWPDSFNPAMRAFFLNEWLPYHRKRGGKRLTVQGVKLQLADLAGISDTTFFDTLNKAIKSNWQSFHVKPDTHANPAQNPQLPVSSANPGPAFGQGAILPGGSAYRKQVIRRGTTAGTGHS